MVHTAGALDGAIIGAICGILVTPVFTLMAKKRQKTGTAMGKPSVREVFWQGSLEEAVDRGQFVLQRLKANVLNVDRAQGTILGGTAANWRSTGSTVNLFVRPVHGGFQVVIQAAPTMSLYDSGFSKSFVNKFMEQWVALGAPRGAGGPGQFVV